MDGYESIFTNGVLLSAIVAWVLAQSVKVVWVLIKEHKFNVERMMGSGGMPSAHSASVVAATFAIGEVMGYGHPMFGLSWVMSFIVMYDAANVRMAAGKQAKVINRIIAEIGDRNIHMDEELKELLGHTYLEVFVGMVLGVIIGVILG